VYEATFLSLPLGQACVDGVCACEKRPKGRSCGRCGMSKQCKWPKPKAVRMCMVLAWSKRVVAISPLLKGLVRWQQLP
jgi:hypothetical protein